MRRGKSCSLQVDSETPPSTASHQTKHQDDSFSMVDFELFNHFTTSTARVIANDPVESSPWLTTMPTLATRHPFLLHEILAVAAIDLSVLKSEDSARYLELGREHHAKALRQLMPALTLNSADLVAPVYACNSLFVSYYFASTPDVASLLFNDDPPGPAQWMVPIRGCVTMFNCYRKTLQKGPLAPFLASYTRLSPDKDKCHLSDQYLDNLQAELRLPAAEQEVIAGALELLRRCFMLSDEARDTMGYKTAALIFPSTVALEFLVMLGQKRQPALAVMAFWCVLLSRVDQGKWWLNRPHRVKDMLDVIRSFLDAESLDLIRWPIQVIVE